jgi:lipid-A-disaccharide synthase
MSALLGDPGGDGVADKTLDLFVIAAEPSADLHGACLLQEILKRRPHLQISAVAGPKMRQLPIDTYSNMETLSVMGFVDVFLALPKIVRQFFSLRNALLRLQPKALICIDYPGFNLRLEKALRKKGYQGKIIHYISPTVWVWGKKRIDLLAKTADLLLTLFPFEKKYFSHTSLQVQYVGHPLIAKIPLGLHQRRKKILAIFPGSRDKEIERNFPLQIETAKKLLALDPELEIGVSIADPSKEKALRSLSGSLEPRFYSQEQNEELMSGCLIALATSGTVTLELALHLTPTVVQYAIHPIDLFIAQKILSIHLPFYCIVNIIASAAIFPELFGPQLTEEQLFFWTKKLWFDEAARREIQEGCQGVRKALGEQNANREAAKAVISLAF